ncbi:MAG TPA: MFS transporter [Bryobacteraceae bacterium]|nr:MFS transporter [Bryobacteraceae bacterium]
MSDLAPVATPTRVSSPARLLSGFLLSGFLFALLGAILPAWGYYRDPPDFVSVGHYFLSINLGMILAARLAQWLLPRSGIRFLLIFASVLACATLLYLAMVPPPLPAIWRISGLAVIGLATGLLHPALFHAISASYTADPAGTLNHGGIFYGLGCLAVTLLVAGTFYAYTVPSILILMATVPGYFAGIFAKTTFPPVAIPEVRGARRTLQEFRSPVAIMFAMLLFFQFGNEWAIAGWLPLFLIRRLGLSPSTSLLLLALYWLALLVGRSGAVAVLPRVRHGRLLGGSVLAALFGYLLLFSTNNEFGAAMAILFIGGGFAFVYPLVSERIGRRFPHYHPGFFNGIFSFGLLSGTLAPATLGYAAAVWDIGVVMALPLLGTCMVCLLLLLMWLEAKVTGQ